MRTKHIQSFHSTLLMSQYLLILQQDYLRKSLTEPNVVLLCSNSRQVMHLLSYSTSQGRREFTWLPFAKCCIVRKVELTRLVYCQSTGKSCPISMLMMQTSDGLLEHSQEQLMNINGKRTWIQTERKWEWSKLVFKQCLVLSAFQRRGSSFQMAQYCFQWFLHGWSLFRCHNSIT